MYKRQATVALCTVEVVTDFSIAKDTTAIAVISKVVAPASVEMMRKLHRFSNTHSADATLAGENWITSSAAAWQQRKCRRLLRYPTLSLT